MKGGGDDDDKKKKAGRNSNSSRNSNSKKTATFDPLDAAGKGPNMVTGNQEYSKERKEWADAWSKFPVYALKDKLRALVDSIEKNRVTVIVSGTGSGKTVLAVPLVLRHVLMQAPPPPKVQQASNGKSNVGSARTAAAPKVAVTIPKKAAVVAAANRGAVTLDVKIGEEVGYLHRGAPSWSYDDRKTRLVYATDGTLLAQIRRDPLLKAYGAVVVDEAHERPVPTDLLLAALKNTLMQRPDFRLVIMSATIDPKLFADYFSAISTGIIEVSGVSMHPIERVHVVLPGAIDGGPPKEYLPPTLEQACKVLKQSAPSGPAAGEPPQIIVFVPTTKDASQGCRMLEKTCQTAPQDAAAAAAGAGAECFSLYGKMSRDAQTAAQNPRGSEDKRARVYVSTNVAESSLTLDGITHVIDTGLQLSSTWDPRSHGSKLVKGMASQAQITQRIGRSGRTGPGKAILLYSKEKLESQPAYPPPAILGVDIAEHTMAEMGSGEGGKTLEEVHGHFASLITPPSRDQVVGSVAALHFYGLIEIASFEEGKANAKGGKSIVPYSLVPYATLAGPATAAPATAAIPNKTGGDGGNSKRMRMTKTKEAAAAAAPKWVSPFEGRVTPLGRMVQKVCDMAKLGIWGALLVVAGAAYDCIEEAFELAVILEACDGELSTLWREYSSPDRNAETATMLKDTELAKLHPQSDHAALLGFFRQNVAPRTRENKQIANKYLAYGPWQKVFEAIRRDRGNTAALMREKRLEIYEWLKSAPHVPILNKEGASAGGVPPLICAIAFSRAYLACASTAKPKRLSKKQQAAEAVAVAAAMDDVAPQKGGDGAAGAAGAGAGAAGADGIKLKTMFPIAPVEVTVDQPIAVAPGAIPPGAVAFVESIVNAGGQWKGGGITWVPHASLSSWLAMAVPKKPSVRLAAVAATDAKGALPPTKIKQVSAAKKKSIRESKK